MKSTIHLEDDHKLILRSLGILDEMTGRVEGGQALNSRDAEDVVLFLKGFADRFHQGKEEGVLFPALLRHRTQKHDADLSAAVFEHDRHRSLMEGLEDSIRTRNSSEFVYFSRRLSRVLRDHVKEEEQNLFEIVNRTLTPSEDEGVKEDMQQYELLWQNQNLPDLLQMLIDLESRYIPRAAA